MKVDISISEKFEDIDDWLLQRGFIRNPNAGSDVRHYIRNYEVKHKLVWVVSITKDRVSVSVGHNGRVFFSKFISYTNWNSDHVKSFEEMKRELTPKFLANFDDRIPLFKKIDGFGDEDWDMATQNRVNKPWELIKKKSIKKKSIKKESIKKDLYGCTVEQSTWIQGETQRIGIYIRTPWGATAHRLPYISIHASGKDKNWLTQETTLKTLLKLYQEHTEATAAKIKDS